MAAWDSQKKLYSNLKNINKFNLNVVEMNVRKKYVPDQNLIKKLGEGGGWLNECPS